MRAILVLLALLAAGCATPAPAPAAETFERPEAPVLATRLAGCGFCAPPQGFSHAQWRLHVVFENGQAALVHLDVDAGTEALHVAPGMRFDVASVEPWLRNATRGHAWFGATPDLWVADVEAGAVDAETLPALREAIDQSWRPPSPALVVGCCDIPGHGVYGRGDGATIDPDREPPPGTPEQQDFLRVMDAFEAAWTTASLASAPRDPIAARVVAVDATLAVNATEEDARLRGAGRCEDATLAEGRVTLPVVMPLGPPALVVLRSLDAASRARERVDFRHVDASDWARADAGDVLALRSLADPSRVLLNLTLENGALLVDGAPFDGAPRSFAFSVEQETWLEEQETTVAVGPPATYRVVETVTLCDLGALPVAMRQAEWVCQG